MDNLADRGAKNGLNGLKFLNLEGLKQREPNVRAKKALLVPEEGIVIKHMSGERQKIAKVINPDYSIYSEKHNVGDSH